VVDVEGFLSLFFGVNCRVPLSSSFLAEFFDGRRFSNGGLGCLSFGGALFEDCVKSSSASVYAMQLLSFQKPVQIPPGVTQVLDD
jgi:hypothetical protein